MEDKLPADNEQTDTSALPADAVLAISLSPTCSAYNNAIYNPPEQGCFNTGIYGDRILKTHITRTEAHETGAFPCIKGACWIENMIVLMDVPCVKCSENLTGENIKIFHFFVL